MEILHLTANHVREIIASNGGNVPTGVCLDDMIKAYLSPGSAAYCLADDGKVIFAGGITNLQWGRGEAWILHTAMFRRHLKTCVKILKAKLPSIAIKYGFRRVQATSFIDNGCLFKLLGFELESPEMKFYGPSGESAKLFVRFFDV